MPVDYRKDQEASAKRWESKTITRKPVSTNGKKPFVAKGHDSILKEAQDAKGDLRIITMSDGAEHVGRMVARDKFTITIEIEKLDGSTVRRTFYKHAIESFERV
jgi:hypothetical protein